MASTPHPSALVMLGDLRVAISQSTHTRAWKEGKGLWRRYKGKVRLVCSHPCLKLSSSTSRIWRQWCRLKPEKVNWLGVAMGALWGSWSLNLMSVLDVRSGTLLFHRRRHTVHWRKVRLCNNDDSGCVGAGVVWLPWLRSLPRCAV
jgi:hypothetical protein